MYTKKRIKSLLGLLAFGRPKYDNVQNMIILLQTPDQFSYYLL